MMCKRSVRSNIQQKKYGIVEIDVVCVCVRLPRKNSVLDRLTLYRNQYIECCCRRPGSEVRPASGSSATYKKIVSADNFVAIYGGIAYTRGDTQMLATCGQYVGHFVHHSFKGGRRTGVKTDWRCARCQRLRIPPLILLWCGTFARVKSAACFMGPWHTVQTLSIKLPLLARLAYGTLPQLYVALK